MVNHIKSFIVTRQSLLTALLLVIGLSAWLLSGANTDRQSKHAQVAGHHQRDTAINVRIRTLRAENVVDEVVLRGRTQPARSVWLRAEIKGRIVAIAAQRGTQVKAGELIVQIDVRDRPALLTRARAVIRQRELEYEAAQKLSDQNFQSETKVAEVLAELEAARAELIRIQLEISNASVRAPFDGVLDERPLEVGDYVSLGDPIARVIEQNPMRVTGHVAQVDVRDIKIGNLGTVALVTGQTLEGEVTYVASESDEETRTFRVELEIDNPDLALAAGVTGEIRIPTRTFTGHFVPPSLLSLNDANELGIKLVNHDDIVEYHRAEIVRATSKGVWIIGLPQTIRLITVGQGFVRTGDKVNIVEDNVIGDRLTSDTRAGAPNFLHILPITG